VILESAFTNDWQTVEECPAKHASITELLGQALRATPMTGLTDRYGAGSAETNVESSCSACYTDQRRVLSSIAGIDGSQCQRQQRPRSGPLD
jgi:hypothetical protein